MQKIGFSHGVLYRTPAKFSSVAFDAYADCGSEIIEICWSKIAEINQIMEVVPFTQKYSRISIHLPSDVRYGDDDVTRTVVEKAFELYQVVGAELAVVHPDLIDSTNILDQYPMNFAAENMDCRKKNYRTVDEMRNFFAAHDSWNMVLDVNHCFSNDPSMQLADDLIAAFRPRIKQTHLSGYAGYHEPLFETKQEVIMEAAKKIDAPIIIESTFDRVEDVKTEFEYVVGFLRGSST